MSSIKQKYIPHDLSKRFRFLSDISIGFLIITIISLAIALFKFSLVIAAINLFSLGSAIITYRTSKSLKPQMSVYYFSIGFLVFAVGNTVFLVDNFLNNEIVNGLMIVSFLLLINLIVLYSVTYKAYQLWIHTLLSLLALLFFNILQFHNLSFNSLIDIFLLNLLPIVFILIVAVLLIYMYQMRTRINEHYKSRYKTEKKHLLKITGNLEFGYASFKVKYNSARQATDAKIEHYNQRFVDILSLNQMSIDEIRISELSKNGNLIFKDYLHILEEFNRKKSFHLNQIEINEELFDAYVFSIENNHMGMMIKKH